MSHLNKMSLMATFEKGKLMLIMMILKLLILVVEAIIPRVAIVSWLA